MIFNIIYNNTKKFIVKNKFIIITMIIIIFTAYMSNTYYHPDEYFQIIEFMSYKLGWTPSSSLAWEFHSKIRPWLQPALYYIIAKTLIFLSITNPFTLLFILRLLTGVFGLISLLFFIKATEHWYLPNNKVKVLVFSFTLWYIPYILVRTSSETLSAILITYAISILLISLKKEKNKKNDFLLSGFIIGLSFIIRYQIAFIIVGIFLWMILINKSKINNLIYWMIGIVVSIGISIIIDYWGYGEWQFTPYLYYKMNIIDKIANKFGVSPFYGYFYILPFKAYGLHGLILLIAMIFLWIRYKTNIVSWTSIAFFLGHSFISHKEGRFLFPLSILATSFIPMLLYGYSNLSMYFNKMFNKKIIKVLIYTLIIFNYIAFVFLITIPFGRDLSLQKFIFNNLQLSTDTLFQINNSIYIRNSLNMNFIKPCSFNIKVFNNKQELEDYILKSNKPTYYTAMVGEFYSMNSKIIEQSVPIKTKIPYIIEKHLNFKNWLYVSNLYNLYKYNP